MTITLKKSFGREDLPPHVGRNVTQTPLAHIQNDSVSGLAKVVFSQMTPVKTSYVAALSF